MQSRDNNSSSQTLAREVAYEEDATPFSSIVQLKPGS